jgi:hypothetical protein
MGFHADIGGETRYRPCFFALLQAVRLVRFLRTSPPAIRNSLLQGIPYNKHCLLNIGSR